MDPRLFYFPVVTLDASGQPDRLCGTAFPITREGDLITCRHVATVPEGVRLGVVDHRVGEVRAAPNVEFPSDESIDLACLRRAVGPGSNFFPLLMPGDLMVGADVRVYGFYTHGGTASFSAMTDGMFKGNVVAFRTEPHLQVILSFPVIEGLSGSPVTTYHNGTKAVGVCIASESQRVVASEVLEFTDENREIRENVYRIVEFGFADRLEMLISFCEELGIGPQVTSESVADPELG